MDRYDLSQDRDSFIKEVLESKTKKLGIAKRIWCGFVSPV